MTTEINAPAQASDEPMPVAWAVFATNGNVRIWFGDKAAADRWKAANELGGELVPLVVTTPRATADVEREKLPHGDREDFYLLANARSLGMNSIHTVRSMPNWVLAMKLFATGSTSAHEICIGAGIDPDGCEVKRIATKGAKP